MKRFFVNYSYDMIKMLLTQVAIALFGFSLVMAAKMMGSDVLMYVTSAFSILFYLFLLYVHAWDIGYRDKASVDVGKQANIPVKGALIALCANSVNFILAIGAALVYLPNVETVAFFGNPNVSLFDVFALFRTVALLVEGMYTGLLSIPIGGDQLVSSLGFVYFLIPIPAIIVCGLAYFFGLKDVNGTSLFNRQPYPASDRAPKRKQEKDRHD